MALLKDAARYTREATEIGRKADLAEAAVDDGRLPETFTTEVGYLLSALSALGNRTVSKETAAALATVLRDLRITVEGSTVRWQVSLLVPASGRVLAVGPFTGAVTNRAKPLSTARVRAAETGAVGDTERRTMRDRLVAQGRPATVARAAAMDPDFLIPRLLVGEVVDWLDPSPDFEARPFEEFVRQQWDALPSWGLYPALDRGRQYLVDLVARMGGSARMDQVCAVSDAFTDAKTIYSKINPIRSTSGAPIYPRLLGLNDEWSAANTRDKNILTSLRCPQCEEPATLIMRVPEVPDALLCRECLVMPSRPNLRFPARYRALGLPSSVIPAEVLEKALTNCPSSRKGAKPRRQDPIGPIA